MSASISSAGRAFAKLSKSYDKASHELELAEQEVKGAIESEVRKLLESIEKKHGVRVAAIYPNHVRVLGESSPVLAHIEIEIEAADS